MTPPTSAIVLAGGKSRRLGRDKRALRLGSSRSQLETTIQRVAEVADDLVVAAGDATEAIEGLVSGDIPGIKVVADARVGAGPLGGLCAGLAVVRHEFALVVACDLPFLDLATLRFLLDRPRDYDLLVPRRSDGRLEMLHAVYRRTCLPVLQRRLAADRLRLAGAVDDLQADRLAVCFVDESELSRLDPGLRSFFNVNTPGELREAERMLVDAPPPLWGRG